MAVSLVGCATESKEPGRSDARVSEVERVLSANGTTTIERLELGYDGSKLSQVDAFKNGTPNGTARVTYFNDKLHRIDFADKDGDRSFTTFEYYGDLLWKTHYEVMGVITLDRTVWYDEATAMVREVKYARNSPGTTTHTWLTKYAYDAQNRVQKLTSIDADGTTQTSEISYGSDGSVKRTSAFTGAQHDETWDFRYLQDGRLDEIYDTHSRNVSVTYGLDNLISELRVLDGSTTESLRYSYEPGTVTGLTFAPEIPVASQFDLAGKSYDDLALMHFPPPIEDDVPGVTIDDGNVCVPDDGTSCSSCLSTSCCDTCTTSSCYSYVSCAASCNGSSSCLSSCAQSYPGNASFGQCATSYCPVSCGL